MIERGARLDARSLDDSQPLHVASREGQVEVIRYLVGVGADVDAKVGPPPDSSLSLSLGNQARILSTLTRHGDVLAA